MTRGRYLLGLACLATVAGACHRGSQDSVRPDPKAIAPAKKTPGAFAYDRRLTPPDGASGDEFGFSVAVDGATAIVGAPQKDVSLHKEGGAAYVFSVDDKTAQPSPLGDAFGAEGDHFGKSVALVGSTAVVGAASKRGAAFVFAREGQGWKERSNFFDSSTPDFAADAVAIGGPTVLVGVATNHKKVGAHTVGAVYVLAPRDEVWDLRTELLAPDIVDYDFFGLSVGVSGSTAIVGAPHVNVGSNGMQGAAYVFAANDGSWKQAARIVAADGALADQFGCSVALSGSTVIVGAFGSGHGSAYVFASNGAAWTQVTKLVATDGADGDRFGWSVAFDGSTAIIGAPGHRSKGAAYVFARDGASWVQQTKLVAPDGAEADDFGWAVGISGVHAVVGAPFKASESNKKQGAAYAFVRKDAS